APSTPPARTGRRPLQACFGGALVVRDVSFVVSWWQRGAGPVRPEGSLSQPAGSKSRSCLRNRKGGPAAAALGVDRNRERPNAVVSAASLAFDGHRLKELRKDPAVSPSSDDNRVHLGYAVKHRDGACKRHGKELL